MESFKFGIGRQAPRGVPQPWSHPVKPKALGIQSEYILPPYDQPNNLNGVSDPGYLACILALALERPYASDLIKYSIKPPQPNWVHTSAIMVKRNVAIAIIIIVLFLLLALAGFAIWAVQNHVSFFSKKRDPDEESAEG
ncbi:hypothetical protein N7481_006210 [Penicillium waksmanii]|uniref:uncharacterized protein n=1 Tax=Penicillium waksmanii TaxID=69791 RepID=UPI0025470354|nr:uncharacterized protein N7481_006210 [Penicillium waksmanii]KAJ5984111.1 hypothetical protein N7481_006210 [Penicillium waksmanii]